MHKEATSQTASLEAIITTEVIDAKQKRDEIMLGTPNAFVQTEIALDTDNIIINIRGQLINILL